MNDIEHENTTIKIEDTDQKSLDSCYETEEKEMNGSNPFFDQPSLLQLKSEYGWKYAITQHLLYYFPHYKLNRSGRVEIEERPTWYQCIAYGTQHVLAMFSGVIVIRNYCLIN